MTTYAEKADIAAKAVKVLDSVRVKRHEKTAKAYANQAMKVLSRSGESRTRATTLSKHFKIKATPVIGCIEDALERMKSRLEKPRYTLKDGEWMLKPKANSILGRMYSRERHLDSLKRLSESQHKELGGGNPYVVGPHNDPTGTPLFGPQTL